MKCEKALKKTSSDRISVLSKKIIDEHIAGCSYCQGQIASSDKVALLLANQKDDSLKPGKRSSLLTNIRVYRDKKRKSILHRLAGLMPLEPAAKGLAIAGVSFAVLIGAYLFSSGMQLSNSARLANDGADDTDFFIQEHALTQDSGLFGHGSFSQTFMGLSAQQNKYKFPNYKN